MDDCHLPHKNNIMVTDVGTYVRCLMPMICIVVSLRITVSMEIQRKIYTTNNGENCKRMDLMEKRIATGS
jgi:hypothetical protein